MDVERAEKRVGAVSATLAIGLMAACYMVVLVNAVYPVLRFSVQPANYAFFFAASALPVRALVVSQRIRGWRRFAFSSMALVLMAPAVGLGLPAAACVALSIPRDGSFERLRYVAAGNHTVAIYRTNNGATTSYGITLRQECRLLPGLRVVRDLGGESPAYEAVVAYGVSGDLQATFPAYSGRRPVATSRPLRLRHWCWGSVERPRITPAIRR